MSTKLTVCGDVEPNVFEQINRCAEAGDAPLAALCADNHLGYSMPIGGVIGYKDFVSPSGVGFDIGCGNMAVCTNLQTADIAQDVGRIMDSIVKCIDFGMGTRPGNQVEHRVLGEIAIAEFVPQRAYLSLAQGQLGTVGSGNHYVDIFGDEKGRVWVGVHFGSRGFGHKTASGFLAMAAENQRRARVVQPFFRHKLPTLESVFFEKAPKGEKMDAPPTLLHVDQELGQSYIAAMKLAGAYAYAGREVVVQRVLDILGAVAVDTVHNHHNYTWLEEHDGEKLWVVRKGATPAFPGQRGFVGATMGEPAVILEGARDADGTIAALARGLLQSTVHGAGRVMSRTAAAGKVRWRWTCTSGYCDWVQPPQTHKPEDGRCPWCGDIRLRKQPVPQGRGRIDWNATLEDMKAKGIELRGAAADEAPGAYKRLNEVLRYHEGTVRILHTLTPLGVAMAGADIRDDYKD